MSRTLNSKGPSTQGYRAESPTRQQDLTCANSFVDLAYLNSRGPSKQGRAIELRAPLSMYFFVSRTLNPRGPSKQGYRAKRPARQQGLTCANSFVDLTCLSSKGPSKQGYRAESPARQVFRRVANSEFKGALTAGLSSREPRSAARQTDRQTDRQTEDIPHATQNDIEP